jgi:PAS domain S-box-containing protein
MSAAVTLPPDPELFRLMADAVKDYAIFLLSPEGHVRSWNTGAALIKGYRAPEIVGKHFSVFYTAEDRRRKWPEYELKCAMTEGRFEDNGWRLRKDGTRFWANVTITALRGKKGELLGFAKITRDLTERKHLEEAMRQSEERFRLLVDGVVDYAIYMLTPDGIVSSWNGGARRITGYEADEIIGRHFSNFYESQDIVAGKPWVELATAREHGRAEDESWRVRKDGTRFWARVVVTALHDGEGSLRGFAKVTQDLTERRHAQALEDASIRLNSFIAVLAHELRNPLAPIRNAAMLLERMRPGDKDFALTTGILLRQTAHLTRIVDDLLDISRVTRGTLDIEKKPVDLRSVVARAVEAATPALQEAGHTLDVRLPEEHVRVLGDELRLSQAVMNVLNNAIRYTDAGGRITIDLSAHRDNEATARAVLSIRDTGQGIEPEMMGAIFGMFTQGRASARHAQTGMGVGLALARSIVELHQGKIEAKSAGRGLGSEFAFELPLLPETEHVDDAPPAVPEVAQPMTEQPRRVLVVDDNVDAATTLATLLRRLGHDVQVVHSGADALRVFEGYRPQIILLDVGMPGMNGLEVARRVRERGKKPDPLIVAVTGWGKPDDVERAREAGFDHHLLKPVEEHELRNVIEAGAQQPKLH